MHRKHLLACLLLPLLAGADDAFAPMAFLAGHCWKGTFPGSTVTDEHCFSWIYDGKFLRDVHVVRAEGKPDSGGESIYWWNSATSQVEYVYIETAGGFSRGTMTPKAGALLFPAADYIDKGAIQTYRTRWTPVGRMRTTCSPKSSRASSGSKDSRCGSRRPSSGACPQPLRTRRRIELNG